MTNFWANMKRLRSQSSGHDGSNSPTRIVWNSKFWKWIPTRICSGLISVSPNAIAAIRISIGNEIFLNQWRSKIRYLKRHDLLLALQKIGPFCQNGWRGHLNGIIQERLAFPFSDMTSPPGFPDDDSKPKYLWGLGQKDQLT